MLEFIFNRVNLLSKLGWSIVVSVNVLVVILLSIALNLAWVSVSAKGPAPCDYIYSAILVRGKSSIYPVYLKLVTIIFLYL
jgi:hypothetical protein